MIEIRKASRRGGIAACGSVFAWTYSETYRGRVCFVVVIGREIRTTLARQALRENSGVFTALGIMFSVALRLGLSGLPLELLVIRRIKHYVFLSLC